jgi:hypothetical protein
MKHSRFLFFAILLFSVAAMAADNSATKAFESLKTLAGTWERTAPDGKTHTSTWSVIASGSVIMETMQPENVVTMYYLDGTRLMNTHYCMAKNQPRMLADLSPDGKTVAFKFLDITNLASPEAFHMRGIAMTLEDANHFSQEWTYRKEGKDKTATFHYVRKQ